MTDPSMTRYYMSMPEAVELVLQAATFAKGSEVFTLEMGEPVNILDLAKKVIRLAGRVPDRDVPIEITGPRPGEKIAEDVRDPDEERLPSGHPSISVTKTNGTDRIAVRRSLSVLQTLCDLGDDVALAAFMRSQAARSWTVRSSGRDDRPVVLPDLEGVG